MTSLPKIPHLQGIIEISLKTPKNPYIIQKRKNFPTQNPNPIPTQQKRNHLLIYKKNIFIEGLSSPS